MGRNRIPQDPVEQPLRHPELYRAYASLVAEAGVLGVGANVRDMEILRLSCLEKLRREGQGARCEEGFVLNFLADIHADWAEDLVTFWDEGLGFGWNVLVADDGPVSLMTRILFRPHRYPFIFLLFELPARLPRYDCTVRHGYSLCRQDPKAPPLDKEEIGIWDTLWAADRYASAEPIDWSRIS